MDEIQIKYTTALETVMQQADQIFTFKARLDLALARIAELEAEKQETAEKAIKKKA